MNPETYVTIWSRSTSGPWLVERSYAYHYCRSIGLPDASGETITGDDGRRYAWFPSGMDPNTSNH